ncbi:MAG TPA: hypothetical protein VNO50_09885 [Pyrinomonadaceae bacterium]|nr:hypothetical protein [Pyrinomonadaceae bacterium]
MSSDQRSLEDIVRELPSDSREKVRSFVEYLLHENSALNDPEFLSDLEVACRRVFDTYRQSSYTTWQELQETLLIRFWRWLPIDRDKAERRTILMRIAVNMLIHAKRIEDAGRSGGHDQTAFDEDRKTFSSRSGRKLKQTWAGALSDFREQYSSIELQKKALEWRGD